MTKTIKITTQAEFDALPESFDEFTNIEIHSAPEAEIVVHSTPGDSQVKACGSSQVTACGSSQVRAYDSSQVRAYDSSQVRAYGSSQVRAYDSSQVRAYGSSQVRAYGSSQVTAYGSSQVTAYGYSACTMTSADAACNNKSKNAVVIYPKHAQNTDEWLQNNGIDVADTVIVYKRVSKDLLTQEGSINETRWAVGSRLECPDWAPDSQECGPGKFHACPSPGLCDVFRSTAGDRYIAVQVKKEDLFVWTKSPPSYPTKIAFKAGLVLGECDMMGNLKVAS